MTAAVLLWAPLILQAAPPAGAPPFARAPVILDMLRRAPEDDALLARALDWSLEQSGDAGALASWVEELGRAAGSGPDLSIAGRLWEEAGRRARALAAYQAALEAAHPPPAAARLAAARLLLAGGWVERAVEIWRGTPRDDLNGAEVWRLEFRRLLLEGKRGEARRLLLDSAREVPVTERARWAFAAGLGELAGELSLGAGAETEAIRLWTGSGHWRRALELARRRPAALTKETALALARLAGDPSVLAAYLGERRDRAAERLHERLALSLGEGDRASQRPASRPADTPPAPAAPPRDR